MNMRVKTGICSYAILGVLLCFFYACKKDKDVDLVAKEGQSLEQIVYADDIQGTDEVFFATTGEWTSSIAQTSDSNEPNWISTSSDHGIEGSHIVRIDLKRNRTGQRRSAVITFSSGNSKLLVRVTQEATLENGEFPQDGPDIVVDDETLLSQTIEGNIENALPVTFTTSGPWNARVEDADLTGVPSWIRLSRYEAGKGTHTLQFMLQQNISEEERLVLVTIQSGDSEIRIVITQKGAEPTTGTVTDVEGNSYPTKRFGNRWWMLKNLQTTRYKDNIAIANASTNAGWNAITFDAIGGYSTRINTPFIYYTFGVVNTGRLCPEGWRVPTESDLIELFDYVKTTYGGGTSFLKELADNNSGIADNWTGSSTVGAIGNNAAATNNASGFSMAAVRHRNAGTAGGGDGAFSGSGQYAGLWTATSSSANNARVFILHYSYHSGTTNYLQGASKSTGYSCRCVRDSSK